MNIRSITQFLLLAFVVAGLGFAIANVVGRNSNPATQEASATTTDALTVDSNSPWVAYYFHARHRCVTCQTIEAYAHEALLPEIEQGEVTWQVVDYTAPENRKLVDHLEVMTSTVVLVNQQDSQIVRFQNLEDDVWKHVSDHDKFLSFMRQAAQEFRKAS